MPGDPVGLTPVSAFVEPDDVRHPGAMDVVGQCVTEQRASSSSCDVPSLAADPPVSGDVMSGSKGGNGDDSSSSSVDSFVRCEADSDGRDSGTSKQSSVLSSR